MCVCIYIVFLFLENVHNKVGTLLSTRKYVRWQCSGTPPPPGQRVSERSKVKEVSTTML